ncbi:MAG: MBL fold metallo-hydrolase [Rhodospirillaceae bacterium]
MNVNLGLGNILIALGTALMPYTTLVGGNGIRATPVPSGFLRLGKVVDWETLLIGRGRMRRIAFGAALAVGLITGAGGPSADSGFPMQAERVAPNVYAIVTPSRDLPNPENNGWNSNSAFVVAADGVILFDTGSSADIGKAIAATIAGVTDKPVRWVVAFHAHGDHRLGNAVFADRAEAIYASEQVTRNVAANGTAWVDRFFRMTEGASGRSGIVAPDTPVTGKTDLVLGGVKVSLVPYGNGHSPGDILMWMPGPRVLLAGDVVYSDRMPSTFDANLRQWITFLDELIALRPAVVVPGHGVVTDRAGLERLRGLLKDFWSAVAAGYEAGKLDYQMIDDVTKALESYREAYPGLAEKVKRDIQHVSLQVEAASFQ